MLQPSPHEIFLPLNSQTSIICIVPNFDIKKFKGIFSVYTEETINLTACMLVFLCIMYKANKKRNEIEFTCVEYVE
jgi:hypothetical protein